MDSVLERIAEFGLLPVIAIEDPASALPLADALSEGGLPLAEIAFRTTAAAGVIETIAHHRSEFIVGAGTVISEDNLQNAMRCGAAFGVAPGVNSTIVTHALSKNFPFVPGVATASDIGNAVALGARFLKFFPATASGGVTMLKSIAAPYAHLGLRYMPTGGINQESLQSYLELQEVVAVGGTWIATRASIEAKRWDLIRDTCRRAIEIIAEIRPSKATILSKN